eukprot:TRINITY_DN16606_c0_g1_i1.p1 TRINITY_DN16606_c0_g1~~TRINITY_DN16606_c0_g1_i1.p1  ORF type:complete len:460 (+),score=51.23 TRINITY_DN16606_c0_g1_i1:46-1425(+)
MAALSGGGPKGPASIAAILCALAVFVRTADGSADAVPAPLAAPVTASGAKEGSAYVVETIPYDTDLKLTSGGRHTWEVLVSFLNEAKEKVDFTAMYQNLVNGTQELSPALRKRWGTDKGKLVYDALRNAAKRGVKLRAVCGVGLSGTDELEQIQREFPEQVTFQLFNASMWYGGGIMHMKAWIFDDNRALITSSNTDWKSLTQVKELGVAVDASPGFELVRDLQLYFNRWWLWTTPTTYRSMKRPQRPVYDPYLQQPRVVPCFSLIGTQIPHTPDPPCENPLRSFPSTKYNLANPMFLKLNGTMGRTILTCSPPEVCDTPNAIYSQFTAALEGRTWDGDALVQTILLAREHVSLSVMDFIPSTMYDTTAGAWWPALNDALVSKAAQGLSIRLLISKWANSLPEMESYLHALRDTGEIHCYRQQVQCGNVQHGMELLPQYRWDIVSLRSPAAARSSLFSI